MTSLARTKMAGAATGQCWECLKRRLVCDLTRPKCRKCHENGTECSGYGKKPLKWMQPGQTRSKGARSKTRLSAAPSKNARTQAAADAGSNEPSMDQKNRVDGRSRARSLALVISPSLKDKSNSNRLLQGIEYCLSSACLSFSRYSDITQTIQKSHRIL